MLYTVENPGCRGVITEPIAAQFETVLLSSLREAFGHLEGVMWFPKGIGGANPRIEWANGSEWLLMAAQTPERIVGFECAFALMDEAADDRGGSQEEAYKMLLARLSQKGFPHWLGVTTTPAGRNWVWREWVEKASSEHEIFYASIYENRANLPEGYIEDLERQYGEGTPLFRRYVMGEFSELEGLVLPMFNEEKHVEPMPGSLRRRIAGIDFGVQNPTAVVEVAQAESRKVYAHEWLYKRECTSEELVAACGEAMAAGVTRFYCDPSAKDRIEWLVEQGIPAVKARSNAKDARVKAWVTPLGRDQLRVTPESGFTIREITGMTWAQGHTDTWSRLCPDHAFDAGAYVLMEYDFSPPDYSYRPTVIERGWV